jgi:RNA polymerase sigma-70 factor (ECF subfamily)
MSERALGLADPLASFDRLRHHEEGAWTTVAGRLGARLRRYFQRVGVRRDEADDLCQDVLGAVFRRIDSVRDPERFDGWVITIARNVLRSRIRRRVVAPEASADVEDLPDVAVAAEESVEAEELRRLVRQELRDMSPPFRRLVELRVLEGRAPGEVWLTLGLHPEQQRRRLHAALKELRGRLRRRYVGEALP